MKNISDRRGFGWLSIALVACYLVVGWWPFAFRPRNQVSWMPDRAGLQFTEDGIAYDPEPLPPSMAGGVAGQPADYTIELWVEPDPKPHTDVFHLLTIHDGRLPSPFVLCQWQKEIILRAATRDSQSGRRIREVSVDGVLEEHNARVITVTGSEAGTDFYLDGKLSGHFPEFVVNASALHGQIILGNSAAGKQSWVGCFFGLAIYHRSLDAEEIVQHHSLWRQGLARQLTNAPSLTALYLFDEGSGQQSKDISRNRHQLMIPASFRPLHYQFLIPPWRDVASNAPNYLDICLNVVGFVPFGFCFFLYRRRARSVSRFTDVLFVIFTGAAISLTIETIQVWLPNRVSSMTDLLGNAAGTLLGVVLGLAIWPKVATSESISNSRG